MRFEFDPEKSSSNASKHGMDFVEAQRLWDDERLLTARARTVGEARYIAIGMVGEVCWSAIFTKRDEVVRLISVRRARREERARYEGE